MNASRIPLFIGPSWPGIEASMPPEIDVRPPARRGDIAAAAAARPPAIALVDGVFETTPSVWHKEILHVLAQGITVFGAASLGALRAAELWQYGMVGIGKVFEAYRDGRQTRDDAVMVLHAPAALSYRPLTVALVDIEATLALADLDPGDRLGLGRAAAATWFKERSWEVVIARYLGARRQPGRSRDLADRIARSAYSIKQQDAALLVDALVAFRRTPVAPPPLDLPQTVFLRRLLADASPDRTQVRLD